MSASRARRFASVRLSGSVVSSSSAASKNQERPFVSGTKGRAFRGATLIRRCRTLVTDGLAAVDAAADRRCPVSLALCAGAYWRCAAHRRAAVRSGGSRVHSPSSPPRFPPATGSLCRRSTGTRPVHQPVLRDVGGSLGGRPRSVKRRQAGPAAGRSLGRVWRATLEARAGDDRQPRVAREARIGPGSLARTNVEPRPDVTTRSCRHRLQRPAGGPLSSPCHGTPDRRARGDAYLRDQPAARSDVRRRPMPTPPSQRRTIGTR